MRWGELALTVAREMACMGGLGVGIGRGRRRSSNGGDSLTWDMA